MEGILRAMPRPCACDSELRQNIVGCVRAEGDGPRPFSMTSITVDRVDPFGHRSVLGIALRGLLPLWFRDKRSAVVVGYEEIRQLSST